MADYARKNNGCEGADADGDPGHYSGADRAPRVHSEQIAQIEKQVRPR
jgi:hypothetical protein